MSLLFSSPMVNLTGGDDGFSLDPLLLAVLLAGEDGTAAVVSKEATAAIIAGAETATGRGGVGGGGGSALT